MVTDGEGLYRLTGLLIGHYDLTIEMPGFAKVDRSGLILDGTDHERGCAAQDRERGGNRDRDRRDAAPRDDVIVGWWRG